jgi:hypothetical protein
MRCVICNKITGNVFDLCIKHLMRCDLCGRPADQFYCPTHYKRVDEIQSRYDQEWGEFVQKEEERRRELARKHYDKCKQEIEAMRENGGPDE